MSRKFTAREKIFLLVCSFMFLSIFYYQVVTIKLYGRVRVRQWKVIILSH